MSEDIDSTDEELAFYEILDVLHSKWEPHQRQIDIGHALFYQGMKNIFICAGRNFGKTELAAYCMWRWALQYPGTQNYIFEPYSKQAREILWASRRIQDFGPNHLIESLNNSEMRITFKNGSFIKLEGSDNVAAIAGIKPKGLIIYDEYKDHRYESIKNFEPNRAAFDVPALFIGTPPEFHNHFVDYMDMAKKSQYWSYFESPTEDNPHISKEWLRRKKEELESMGEHEEWLRSYMAIYVKGGKRSIYPWILKAIKYELTDILPKDLNKWRIVVSCDPASTSTFGVVIAFWNEYTKKLIVFDEIYETDSTKMTSRQMWKAIQEKLKPWTDKVRGVDYVYDEAAAWFRNEISEIDPNIWLTPSRKTDFGIDGYINLVRNVMNHGLVQITSNCVKFFWEHENFIKNDDNKIPKENDHLVNAFQYLCGFLGLDFSEKDEPKVIEKMERRAYRIDEDMNIGNEYAEID